MPTRFAKQLVQVLRGACAIGLDRERALRLALRCARDSMPPLRLAILEDVAAHPGARTPDVRRRLNKPRNTVDRQLQALHMLGVLTCEELEQSGKQGTMWRYYVTEGINPSVLSVPDLSPPIHENTRSREEEEYLPPDISGNGRRWRCQPSLTATVSRFVGGMRCCPVGLARPVEPILILGELQNRGFQLSRDGDDILVRPFSKLTHDQPRAEVKVVEASRLGSARLHTVGGAAMQSERDDLPAYFDPHYTLVRNPDIDPRRASETRTPLVDAPRELAAKSMPPTQDTGTRVRETTSEGGLRREHPLIEILVRSLMKVLRAPGNIHSRRLGHGWRAVVRRWELEGEHQHRLLKLAGGIVGPWRAAGAQRAG